MDSLPSRQQEVLRATVHHYVDTIEPVGSRTLVKRFGLQASSATVRSAMRALEQRGLLTQPHTSAGRVPSAKGYRHYVDCLLPQPGATATHLEQELTQLSLHWAAFDDLLHHMTRRLTDFTGLMSLITHPNRQQPALEAIRLVRSDDRLLVMLVDNANQAHHLNLRLPHGSEGQVDAVERWTQHQLERNGNGQLDWQALPQELQACGRTLRSALQSHRQLHPPQDSTAHVRGVSRLIAEPEFSQSARVRPLLELMDDQPTALVATNHPTSRGVWIGEEHPQPALHHCSVVQATYRSGGDGSGHVALMGPMRMAYATAIAAVQSVARTLERLLA
ncbi:MAG: heat-inducible transcriptional repressor HrcA [Synechococcus sp.]